ncbi:MAG: hypothetical protein QF724_11960 [Planctomycetota bacterium]|jgi:hypothetical protein|nr:hypothetical protein [Planctomycetota bacterium]MDP6839642.1 hypothetical protein [Planctomycetota bacterium]MDP6956117.1 hypothetical protein [Planctomycetota bacterium]
MKTLTPLLSCGALAFLLTPLWAAGQCPDVGATQVDARVDESTSGRECGIGFSLFGHSVSIGGEFCPSFKFIYPAHQVCDGQASPGNRCVPKGNLPVRSQACECALFGALGTGLSLPECDCNESALNAGHVEDAETVPCREPR